MYLEITSHGLIVLLLIGECVYLGENGADLFCYA